MTRARDLADSADKDIAGTITLDAVNASGVITGLTVEATGTTAAGDNAAMGYTTAEGLILTGQGSTNDVTIKNDANADVIEIPTGTVNVTMAGTLSVAGTLSTATGIVHLGDTNTSLDFGTDTQRFYTGGVRSLDFGTGETVFNEDQANIDFRIESDTDADTFVLDAGTGVVKIIGKTGASGSVITQHTLAIEEGGYNNGSQLIVTDSGGNKRFDSDGEGVVMVGAYSAQTVAAQIPRFQVGSNSALESTMLAWRRSADANGPSFHFAKSRNTGGAAFTVVNGGDSLGKIEFYADDGANMDHSAAEIQVIASSTASGPSSNDVPGIMIFKTTADNGNSPTEAMRITSAQELVMGKTVTTLTTDGAVLASGQLTISAASSSTNHATANGASIALANGNSTNANFSHIGGYNANGLVTSQINFINQVQSSRRGVISFNTHDGSSMPERGRFNNFGQFLVGCTQIPSASVPGFAVANNAGFCFVTQATSDANLNTVTQFINPNGVVGRIQTTGSQTNYVSSSDYRLKENVVYDWDATTRLKQLKPARFNFIADADKTVDGFLAHEAATVVPEAVTGTKDAVQVWKEHEELPEGVSVGDTKLDTDGNTLPDVQGIDQAKLVPLLVKTILELEARITALEA